MQTKYVFFSLLKLKFTLKTGTIMCLIEKAMLQNTLTINSVNNNKRKIEKRLFDTNGLSFT